MLKLLAFLILLAPANPVSKPIVEPVVCTCPNISDLQKTAETSNSITYSWNNAYSGAQYRVWYSRQEDSYTSGFFYTYNTAYTFTGLSAGHYTFYFQAICGGETSGYIGTEDLIM
jgi:hypothetical protein